MTTITGKQISIYCGGPIDAAVGLPDWRKAFQKILNEKNIPSVIFDPLTAFKLGTPSTESEYGGFKFVEHVNTQAMALADTAVFFLPRNTFTFGTILEIDKCNEWQKHCYIMTDLDISKSVYLANRVNNDRWTIYNLDNVDTNLHTIASRIHETQVNPILTITMPGLSSVDTTATPKYWWTGATDVKLGCGHMVTGTCPRCS